MNKRKIISLVISLIFLLFIIIKINGYFNDFLFLIIGELDSYNIIIQIIILICKILLSYINLYLISQLYVDIISTFFILDIDNKIRPDNLFLKNKIFKSKIFNNFINYINEN